MTGLGFTGNIVAILVLLLVIGMTWLLLRRRVGQSASTLQRNRADRGKVTCYHIIAGGDGTYKCKNKAGWVTSQGYFCESHWEINSQRANSKVRWANKLAWRRMENDVWMT